MLNDTTQLLGGAIPASLLALAVEGGFGLLEYVGWRAPVEQEPRAEVDVPGQAHRTDRVRGLWISIWDFCRLSYC